MTERKRQRNDGLRKVCGCPRRNWPKCLHPWHFNMKWNGVSHQSRSTSTLADASSARAEARKQADLLRTKIRDGKFNQPTPMLDALTVAQLSATFRKEYLVSRRAASLANDTHQLGAINRTPVEMPTGDVKPFGEWLAADVTPLALERFHAVRAVKLTLTPKGGRRR